MAVSLALLDTACGALFAGASAAPQHLSYALWNMALLLTLACVVGERPSDPRPVIWLCVVLGAA